MPSSSTEKSPCDDRPIPPEEWRLFLEMRDRIREGARVLFKEDHQGELIAIEEVLHRSSELDSERAES